ncbi:MAG: hypothetical protein ACOCQR_02755 [bacterium]
MKSKFLLIFMLMFLLCSGSVLAESNLLSMGGDWYIGLNINTYSLEEMNDFLKTEVEADAVTAGEGLVFGVRKNYMPNIDLGLEFERMTVDWGINTQHTAESVNKGILGKIYYDLPFRNENNTKFSGFVGIGLYNSTFKYNNLNSSVGLQNDNSMRFGLKIGAEAKHEIFSDVYLLSSLGYRQSGGNIRIKDLNSKTNNIGLDYSGLELKFGLSIDF